MAVKKNNKKKRITRSVTQSLNRDKELKMHKKITRHFDISKEKNELMSFINTVMQKIGSKLLVLSLIDRSLSNVTNDDREKLITLTNYYKEEITKLKTSIQICEHIKANNDPLDAFEAITLISSTIMESCVKMEEKEEEYKLLINPYSEEIKNELQRLINNPEEATETRQELINFIDDDDTNNIKIVEVESNGEREEGKETEDTAGDAVSRAD